VSTRSTGVDPNAHSPAYDELAASLRSRPFNADTTPIEDLRAGFEKFAASWANPPAVVREPASAGGVPGEWSRPQNSRDDAAVLYLHGGGYSIGSIPAYRDLSARIAFATDVPVLTLDYRLAPENKYPAAVEDAVAAYQWLTDRVPAGRIVVAGDSAGGGLSMALTLALRDSGQTLPSGVVLISALLDLAHSGASVERNADLDPIVTPAGSHSYAQRYLALTDDPRTPLASPLFGDLSGLPPLYIEVGTAECLLDDSLRLARRARDAGNDVELDVWPDMFHIMPFFASRVPEAALALEHITEFIRRRIPT